MKHNCYVMEFKAVRVLTKKMKDWLEINLIRCGYE